MAFVSGAALRSTALPRGTQRACLRRGRLCRASRTRACASAPEAPARESGSAAGAPRPASRPARAVYDGESLGGFAAQAASAEGTRLVPMWRAVFGDQLTPVIAYRCLVPEEDVSAPSFLLESVETGARVGRYSYVGAKPWLVLAAKAMDASVQQVGARDAALGRVVDGMATGEVELEQGDGGSVARFQCADPWALARGITEEMKAAQVPELPGGSGAFSGGWVGYGGYDTMRYGEIGSLPFETAPEDDRGLADMHMGLYKDVIVFDHVKKVVYVVHWVDLAGYAGAAGGVDAAAVAEAHRDGVVELETLAETLSVGRPLSPLRGGRVTTSTQAGSASSVVNSSNMTREQFGAALDRIHTHIVDGDAFQVVFSQRFERWSTSDPFSTYRALRVINPSPYMIYAQTGACVLVASSPEILCRVVDGEVTNRPLAGTRPRGRTPEEDAALEEEMLADEKDRAEHYMLVDLGRNDVGRVARAGTVRADQLLDVEHYSNVMHISSTVKGQLRDELASWDGLRAQLPAGTISGAPKIRAMQIIDDLEPTRRGPYGGGIGYISLQDTMNMALALRTLVVPHVTRTRDDGVTEWLYHLQAGAGIVLDSDTELEYQETINKAMGLNRAIDLAETAFEQGAR